MNWSKRAFPAIAAVIMILVVPVDSDEKKHLKFDISVRGEIVDKAATAAGFRTRLFPQEVHLGFKDLDASDGEKLTIQDGEFRTADEATRYFEWNIRERAGKVIAQGKKKNRAEETVGRRAEFLAKTKEKRNPKTFAVMWTERAWFFVVLAPSLECALEVENQSQH